MSISPRRGVRAVIGTAVIGAALLFGPTSAQATDSDVAWFYSSSSISYDDAYANAYAMAVEWGYTSCPFTHRYPYGGTPPTYGVEIGCTV
jgi:hypothetical protein